MFVRRCLPVVLPLLLHGWHAAAQVPADTAAVTDRAEELLEDLDPDAEGGEPLAEWLQTLAEHPLDINTASAAALARIPALSPLLAQALVRYRKQHGSFASIPEIRRLPGITEAVFIDIRPYLTIGKPDPAPPRYPPPPSFGTIVRGLSFEVMQRYGRRLDLGRGYADDTTRTTYAGSPERHYTRLRAFHGHRVQLALLMEKDPGERFTWDPATATYGYDHITAHLALEDFGRLRTLVVGDYVVNVGQGLLLWRNGAFGKGRDPVRPIARSGSGIDAYASSVENTFFRGAAAAVRLTPQLTVSTFGSRRRLDATIVEADTSSDGDVARAASTLLESGLHRTPTELSKKNALGETLVGGIMELELSGTKLGVAGYYARFDDPITPGVRPYERFQFAGDHLTVASMYGHATLGNVYLFGEAARGPGNTLAGVAGLLLDIGRQADALVLVRHYPRNFQSLHGYAFGERNGTTQNETGYYVGLRLRPAPAWTLAAYFDQYHFPYLRYGLPRPGDGYDVRLVAEHRPRRWLSYYVQLRSETREAGTSTSSASGRLLNTLRPETHQSLRLQGDYAFSTRLALRARAEAVRFQAHAAPTEYGTLLYHQLHWTPVQRLQVYLRLAFFDTDSWAARVYTYENDLLYTFAVPVFSGRGQRAFVLFRLTPHDNLRLEFKAAVTHYEDVDTIGSGLDQVDGNRLREIRAQLRWRF